MKAISSKLTKITFYRETRSYEMFNCIWKSVWNCLPLVFNIQAVLNPSNLVLLLLDIAFITHKKIWCPFLGNLTWSLWAFILYTSHYNKSTYQECKIIYANMQFLSSTLEGKHVLFSYLKEMCKLVLLNVSLGYIQPILII